MGMRYSEDSLDVVAIMTSACFMRVAQFVVCSWLVRGMPVPLLTTCASAYVISHRHSLPRVGPHSLLPAANQHNQHSNQSSRVFLQSTNVEVILRSSTNLYYRIRKACARCHGWPSHLDTTHAVTELFEVNCASDQTVRVFYV